MELPGSDLVTAGWQEDRLVIRADPPDDTEREGIRLDGNLLLQVTADAVDLVSGQEKTAILGPPSPEEVLVTIEGPAAVSSLTIYRY